MLKIELSIDRIQPLASYLVRFFFRPYLLVYLEIFFFVYVYWYVLIFFMFLSMS